MPTWVLGLLAETPIHPGTGQSIDVIDLPVMREKTTQYPVVVGSSLKGALRQRAEELWGVDGARVSELFGARERGAGALMVSDARLLLLPVRSLNAPFVWITCPYAIERFNRDAMRSGCLATCPPVPALQESSAITNVALRAGEPLMVEEWALEPQPSGDAVLAACVDAWLPIIPHQSVQDRLRTHLAIVHDNLFTYLAQYGLPIMPHNVLDDLTKTSQNLWYEEALAPETVLYSLLAERPGAPSPIREHLDALLQRPYLQVGGNETIGYGWCAVRLASREES
jgi:CRISPR-associated protein Cmr4